MPTAVLNYDEQAILWQSVYSNRGVPFVGLVHCIYSVGAEYTRNDRGEWYRRKRPPPVVRGIERAAQGEKSVAVQLSPGGRARQLGWDIGNFRRGEI